MHHQNITVTLTNTEFLTLVSMLHHINRNMKCTAQFKVSSHSTFVFDVEHGVYDAFLSLNKKIDDITYEKIRLHSVQEAS